MSRTAAKVSPGKGGQSDAGPISLEWAAATAESFGLTGPLAHAVAEKIAKALASALANRTTRPKLAKLVRAAVKEAIR